MVRERSWHKAASKRALSGEGSLKRRLRFWLPHEATLGEIVTQWWWGCLKKSLPVLTSICRGCLTLEVSREQREDSCHVIQPGIDVHRGTRWDHTLISQLQGPACFLTSTSSERGGGFDLTPIYCVLVIFTSTAPSHLALLPLNPSSSHEFPFLLSRVLVWFLYFCDPLTLITVICLNVAGELFTVARPSYQWLCPLVIKVTPLLSTRSHYLQSSPMSASLIHDGM